MTAARVMDIISKLPGCDRQAADAVSDEIQVKMEDADNLLKNTESECPYIWIRQPRHKWSKSWSCIEDPVVPLEQNLYGYPFGKTIMAKAIWENLIEARLGESFNWECLFVHRQNVLFLSVYVDDIKLAGKETKHWSVAETIQQKKSIWENQHLSLIMFFLGCTPR